MASPGPDRHRLLLPTILAAVLAVEITGLAIARSLAVVAAPSGAAGATSSLERTTDQRADGPLALVSEGREASPDAGRDFVAPLVAARRAAPTPANLHGPAPSISASPRATSSRVATSSHPTSHPRPSAAGHSVAPAYRGRNHVWIPSLGINRSVQSFPCSRSRPPDAGVYRWGCAGRNNVYLMAHAWSAFDPLHDAYVAGRLHTGMRVWYADGGGRTHSYSVVWWRVTAPTTAASWAWSSLSRPGMTLQTCVGANSQYRLMVRLVQVG